ncbi:MAG: hypothetical protein SVM80_08360 [Halobacteriota archaeon]|nr:hypothetical protein [Halobacteriota archaeon]
MAEQNIGVKGSKRVKSIQKNLICEGNQNLKVEDSEDVNTKQIIGKEEKEELNSQAKEILEKIQNKNLKRSAEELREYCMRLLDASYATDDHYFKFFTNHASYHSQIILKRLKEILSETRMKNDYEYYLLFTAAYAHDLGMLPQKINGVYEDYASKDVVVLARKRHHVRSYEYIKANWREMGLIGETESEHLGSVCKAHSSKEDINKVDESAGCIIDGEKCEVRLRFLATLIRLADGLDLEHRRIPPEFITQGAELSEKDVEEYIKHGSVKNVSVNHKDQMIYIELLFKEKEPDKDVIESMKKHVLEEFDSVKKILWENGVDIKGVEFLETQSK